MTMNNPFPAVGAANDLGLGNNLVGEVADETEEARKKRMAELKQKQMLGPAGSLSVTSLFGMNGGGAGVGY